MKQEYYEVLFKSIELAKKLFVHSTSYNKQISFNGYTIVLKSLTRTSREYKEFNIKIYTRDRMVLNFGVDNYRSNENPLRRYSIQSDGLSYDRYCVSTEQVPSGDFVSDVNSNDVAIENNEEWFFQNSLIYNSVPSYEDYTKSLQVFEKALQEMKASYCYISVFDSVNDSDFVDDLYEYVYQEVIENGLF